MIEPRFSTEWERADYEREKRGEKPLGPMQPAPSPASEAPDMEAARRFALEYPKDGEAANLARAFQALDKPPSPPSEAVAASLADTGLVKDIAHRFVEGWRNSTTEQAMAHALRFSTALHAAVQALVEQAREEERARCDEDMKSMQRMMER